MKKIFKCISLILLIVSTCLCVCSCSAVNVEENEEVKPVTGIYADEDFYNSADFSVLKGKKIGITVQYLQNAYWAGVMTAMEEVLNEAGAEYTIVSCNDSAAVQIAQIESFMASKCDLIMVHPSESSALENVCQDARSKGIKVMCWDNAMDNTDANWILDNTDLGYAIGKLASNFINERYTAEQPAEVIVIGDQKTKVLFERENGMVSALNELSGDKCKIVASQPGLIASEAQTSVETILQAYPNAKIVVGVGSGAMTGADEALNIYTGGNIPDDMGVFTTDVTKQQLEQLEDPKYPAKGIVGFEGSDVDTAKACASMFALILDNKIESLNVFRSFSEITEENVKEIYSEMK